MGKHLKLLLITKFLITGRLVRKTHKVYKRREREVNFYWTTPEPLPLNSRDYFLRRKKSAMPLSLSLSLSLSFFF
jgi:hypothetical protein